jgi:hypothetical protein
MLPDGYVGLVVADTRRALEWEAGLEAAGFRVMRVETRGADADKGAWQIGVPRFERARAQTFVTEVINGDRKLPARTILPRSAQWALVGVVVVLAALLLIGLLD